MMNAYVMLVDVDVDRYYTRYECEEKRVPFSLKCVQFFSSRVGFFFALLKYNNHKGSAKKKIRIV